MTPPDQILARLQATCPNLDWTYWYVTDLDIAEYDGHIRNSDRLPPVLLNLRQYGDSHRRAYKAYIRMLELMHTFDDIEAAIEWLEWLQGAIGTADISADIYVRAAISRFGGSTDCEWEVVVMRRSPKPMTDDELDRSGPHYTSSMAAAKRDAQEFVDYLDDYIDGRIAMVGEELDSLRKVRRLLRLKASANQLIQETQP